jgi:gamma-glutamylcyclotransferase (GGCT)/AIG2-like uncharacterized protein YtfP
MISPFLFVYGTLRRLYGHPQHAVLERNGGFVGEGTIQAQLFYLGNYPGARLSVNPSDRVFGEVYCLEASQTGDTLRQLDEYEGLGHADPEVHEYRREIVTVRLADGSVVDAWAYVLNLEPQGCLRILSGDYLEWRDSREPIRSGKDVVDF